MTTRITDNQFKATIYFVLFAILLFMEVTAVSAQSGPKRNKTYLGFVTSFGTRSFKLQSNIEKLNQSTVSQSGANLGITYGNNVLRSRVGLVGYFSSSKNVPGTIDLFRNNVLVNFYPLALIQKNLSRVQPYINAGVSYDRFKFYGHYLNEDPGKINYSSSEAPYIGKIKQINNSIGSGVEFRIIENHTFVHFFSEVRYVFNISNDSNNSALNNTSVKDQMLVNFGISFGSRR
jgi:hypothetical protein